MTELTIELSKGSEIYFYPSYDGKIELSITGEGYTETVEADKYLKKEEFKKLIDDLTEMYEKMED